MSQNDAFRHYWARDVVARTRLEREMRRERRAQLKRRRFDEDFSRDSIIMQRLRTRKPHQLPTTNWRPRQRRQPPQPPFAPLQPPPAPVALPLSGFSRLPQELVDNVVFQAIADDFQPYRMYTWPPGRVDESSNPDRTCFDKLNEHLRLRHTNQALKFSVANYINRVSGNTYHHFQVEPMPWDRLPPFNPLLAKNVKKLTICAVKSRRWHVKEMTLKIKRLARLVSYFDKFPNREFSRLQLTVRDIKDLPLAQEAPSGRWQSQTPPRSGPLTMMPLADNRPEYDSVGDDIVYSAEEEEVELDAAEMKILDSEDRDYFRVDAKLTPIEHILVVSAFRSHRYDDNSNWSLYSFARLFHHIEKLTLRLIPSRFRQYYPDFKRFGSRVARRFRRRHIARHRGPSEVRIEIHDRQPVREEDSYFVLRHRYSEEYQKWMRNLEHYPDDWPDEEMALECAPLGNIKDGNESVGHWSTDETDSRDTEDSEPEETSDGEDAQDSDEEE